MCPPSESTEENALVMRKLGWLALSMAGRCQLQAGCWATVMGGNWRRLAELARGAAGGAERSGGLFTGRAGGA